MVLRFIARGISWVFESALVKVRQTVHLLPLLASLGPYMTSPPAHLGAQILAVVFQTFYKTYGNVHG